MIEVFRPFEYRKINVEEFCRNLTEMAGQPVVNTDPRTLVGILQKFRPDGSALSSLFDFSPIGREMYSRLSKVFEVAGNPNRSDGMKDAFFIVRHPQPYDLTHIRESGEKFFNALANLAFEQGLDEVAECLSPLPNIRIVEGAVPKHPKLEPEQSRLMKAIIKAGATVTDSLIENSEAARFLKSGFYFVACDAYLRDYLLWPLIEHQSTVDEPFSDYFELWRFGVKVRIFNEKQIDLYLPRHF